MIGTIFVVTRVGVYGQGVVGAAVDYDDAVAVAEHALGLECDDYHEFEITSGEVSLKSSGWDRVAMVSQDSSGAVSVRQIQDQKTKESGS